MPSSPSAPFLVFPRSIVILLILANAILFALCAIAGGTPFVTTHVLVAHGALVPAALQRTEAWRLVAYGFLHGNPGHLIANIVSLVICGPLLERRLGASSFTLIYAATLVGAAIASIVLHQGPLVEVGASGALFGIQGALFALLVLGATEVSPSFFLTSFATNFAFSIRDPQIDWAAHVGGFITGMACIALLDLVARTNAYWMRCKFPEFVKMNTMLLIALGAASLWFFPLRWLPNQDPRLIVAAGALAAIMLIKSLDYLLAARHGLVGAVLVLAVGNGMAVYGFGAIMHDTLGSLYPRGASLGLWADTVGVFCRETTMSIVVAAVCAGVLTSLVFARPLRRGIRDVGFVGATYVGDRGRERGLVRPARYTRA